MKPITLTTSTNAPMIVSRIESIIGAYEHAFPDRICSYYLIGSYVEHTAVALSDIDCFVIFANDFISLEEQQRAEHIGQQCALESPVRLDIGAYPQNKLDSLYPFIRVALKLGSSLLYGTDIRAMIRIPDLSEYIPSLSAGAQYFIARIRGQTELTAKFVDYPDASDSFFGYTSKSIAAWYPATVDAGTKELVATTSRIAGAIVAYEAQRYIPGKQAAIALFQELGNPWAAFVQDVYYTCKIEWKYLVPQAEQARQQLRKLCQQMLGFENMFLQTYCGTV